MRLLNGSLTQLLAGNQLERPKSAGKSSTWNASDTKRRKSVHAANLSPTVPSTQNVPIRPQTSDGSAQRRSALRANLMDAMDIKAGTDIFAFPTPSPRILHPHTPNRPSPPTASGESPTWIGIAIGSPTHRPSGSDYFTSVTKTAPKKSQLKVMEGSSVIEQSDGGSVNTQESKKSRTWKKVGKLFRRPTQNSADEQSAVGLERVAASHSQPSYEVSVRAGPESSSQTNPDQGPSVRHHSRSRSFSAALARLTNRGESEKPSVVTPPLPLPVYPARSRAATAKTVDSQGTPAAARLKDLSDLRISQQADGRPASRHNRTTAKSPSPPQSRQNTSPTPKNSPPPNESSEPKSALLERRRSRLSMLASTDDADTTAKKDNAKPALVTIIHTSFSKENLSQKHPTTSSPSPSRSLSLHGSKSKVFNLDVTPAFHKPLRLRRSKTSPSARVSPLHTDFAQAQSVAMPARFGVKKVDSATQLNKGSANKSLPLIPTVDKETAVASASADVVSPISVEHPQHAVQVTIARANTVARARVSTQKPTGAKAPLRPRMIDIKSQASTTRNPVVAN